MAQIILQVTIENWYLEAAEWKEGPRQTVDNIGLSPLAGGM